MPAVSDDHAVDMARIDVISGSTSGVLSGLAALHVAWGLGSTWPCADADALAETVVGGSTVPPPVACFAVAGALGTAAALVSGVPTRFPRLLTLGQAGVASVLGARLVLGFLGRANLVSPDAPSPQFQRLDRRLYSPLCLALAAGAARSLTRRRCR